MRYVPLISARPTDGVPLANGLTILEILVTLGIAAILLLAGIPTFSDFTLRQRMNAVVNSLHSDLNLARGQAIHRFTTVTACPGNPQDGCVGGSDWSGGWIVFSDLNDDRQRQDTEPLSRHGHGDERITILSAASRPDVRFFPNGSAPGSNGSISLCGPRGPAHARKLVISNLGRIRRDLAPDLDESRCP